MINGFELATLLSTGFSAMLYLIVSVEFDWIKYFVYWHRSGPGWYAGIKTTKEGNWPKDVVRSKSEDFNQQLICTCAILHL